MGCIWSLSQTTHSESSAADLQLTVTVADAVKLRPPLSAIHTYIPAWPGRASSNSRSSPTMSALPTTKSSLTQMIVGVGVPDAAHVRLNGSPRDTTTSIGGVVMVRSGGSEEEEGREGGREGEGERGREGGREGGRGGEREGEGERGREGKKGSKHVIKWRSAKVEVTFINADIPQYM